MNNQTLMIVVAVIFLAVFGVATGGFTQANATREATIQTGEGYLSATTQGNPEPGTDIDVLFLKNGFSVALESINVEVINGGTAVSNVSVPDRLQPGEQKSVRADVTCDAGDSFVAFEISVSGATVSVTTNRTVKIDCPT